MKKKVRILALVLGTLMLLSACAPSQPQGGGQGTPAPAPTNNGGTPATAAPSTPGKDDLIVAVSTEPSSLDPHNVNMVTAFMIGQHVIDRLFVADAEYNITPSLAEKYEWLDDTTLQVKIREDVDFSNGQHMTADDVVYSIQRACTMSQSAATFDYFDGPNTVKVDEYTVNIKLKAPYPNALRVLCGGRGGIVCKSAIEEMGEDAYGRAPVGSGAFIVTNWSSGDRIELTRNDNYWGDKPAYKDLTFRIITENASRTIEVETGGVDIAWDIGSDDVARLEADPNVNIVRGASSTMNHIVINSVNFDTLKDPKVREAMHMALDMDAIVAVAFKGYATVAESLSPNSTTEFAKVGPTAYDPEGAKALIAESGFDTSTPIVLQIYKNQQIQSMAEIIANMWTAVGLNVQIEVVDRATMVTNNSSGKTPMCITSVTCSDGNIESVFRQWEKPETGFTDDEALIAAIKAAKGIMDDAERKAAYAELQQQCWDLNTVIPIATGENIFGVRSNVQGFVFHPDKTPNLTGITFG